MKGISKAAVNLKKMLPRSFSSARQAEKAIEFHKALNSVCTSGTGKDGKAVDLSDYATSEEVEALAELIKTVSGGMEHIEEARATAIKAVTNLFVEKVDELEKRVAELEERCAKCCTVEKTDDVADVDTVSDEPSVEADPEPAAEPAEPSGEVEEAKDEEASPEPAEAAGEDVAKEEEVDPVEPAESADDVPEAAPESVPAEPKVKEATAADAPAKKTSRRRRGRSS